METADKSPDKIPDLAAYALTERRIATLTLLTGAITATAAAFFYPARVAAGVLVGAILAWVNFRWLKSALDAVMRASAAQAQSADVRMPLGSIFGLIGRYLLIGACVCVTFIVFRIPVLSMLVGLCALGVATIGASLLEVFQSWE